jgi:hypothetical protein
MSPNAWERHATEDRRGQDADRRTVQPEDEVAFLMSGNSTVVRLGRSLADHDLGANEWLSPSACSRSRHP